MVSAGGAMFLRPIRPPARCFGFRRTLAGVALRAVFFATRFFAVVVRGDVDFVGTHPRCRAPGEPSSRGSARSSQKLDDRLKVETNHELDLTGGAEKPRGYGRTRLA
jgi:hypothetical protein